MPPPLVPLLSGLLASDDCFLDLEWGFESSLVDSTWAGLGESVMEEL